jgi:hypothetical protein
MVTPEQANSIAADVANRAGLPIDMTLTLAFRTGKRDDGSTLDVIRIGMLMEADDEEDNLQAGMIMQNLPDMQPETFEVWLLGYIQGCMSVVAAAEAKAMREDLEAVNPAGLVH